MDPLAIRNVLYWLQHVHGDDGCEQVRSGDPGVEVETPEFSDDSGQRGAHHGLIECDQHGHEADAQHRHQRFAKREHLSRGVMLGSMNSHFLIPQ